MLVIKSPSNDAYFNIAAEEFLLKNKSEDIFLIYKNNPAIIVGKHQNTIAEINKPFVEANNIKVVRRMTGGGAVYHDEGNLNFSFHVNSRNEDIVDFSRFTKPIIDLLNQMGVRAMLKGRNDLVIDDKKFSGNAKMVYKKKVLQHGTLLFDSNMGVLSDALKVNPLKFKDKAVKSVRARVTNIIDYLPEPMDIDQFSEKLIEFILKLNPDCELYEMSHEEVAGINKLVREKYSKWTWNYGNSPDYNFKKGIKTPAGYIEFHLDVQRGIIKHAKIFGDFFSSKEVSILERQLSGTKHDYIDLKIFLHQRDITEYFGMVTKDEILDGLI